METTRIFLNIFSYILKETKNQLINFFKHIELAFRNQAKK